MHLSVPLLCYMNFLLLLGSLAPCIWIAQAQTIEASSGGDTVGGDPVMSKDEAKQRAADSRAKYKEAQSNQKRSIKKSKDWNKINFNELEKGWEDGDEEDELELEFDRNRKIAAKKMQDNGLNFNPDDPESVKKFVKAQKQGVSTDGNPVMMFITLPDEFEGKKWTPDSRKSLCQKWATLLRAGAVDAELYDIGDASLLINVKKGWLARDALKFLLQQPEAVKVTKDSKDFYLKDVMDEEDEL